MSSDGRRLKTISKREYDLGSHVSTQIPEVFHDRSTTIEPMPVATRLSSGLCVVVDPTDRGLGRHIVRERFEVAELAFAQRSMRPGAVGIDAGAHVGVFALYMAQAAGRDGHVVAFEPLEANARCLDQAIEENGFKDRIVVHRRALADVSGAGDWRLATHAGNSGGAFLVARGSDVPNGSGQQPVTCLALDDAPRPGRVSFMKMDIEGAELLALKGASRLLAADRPLLLCDVDYPQLAQVSNAQPEDLFMFVKGFGYDPYCITHDGLIGRRLEEPPTARVSSVAFVAR
jgi:FkbM family methyltransferase